MDDPEPRTTKLEWIRVDKIKVDDLSFIRMNSPVNTHKKPVQHLPDSSKPSFSIVPSKSITYVA